MLNLLYCFALLVAAYARSVCIALSILHCMSIHSTGFQWSCLSHCSFLFTAAIGGGDLLTREEINIIGGALDLTGKQASVAMTPLDKVFMLPLDAALDEPTMRRILASGHSRVPVHRPGNRCVQVPAVAGPPAVG